MPDITVMLSPNFDQTFRRSVRDEAGKVVEQLIFERGCPVRVPAKLIDAIRYDIGKALLLCVEKNGVLKPDHEATQSFLEQPVKRRRKAAKKEVVDEPEQADGPVHDEPVPEQE